MLTGFKQARTCAYAICPSDSTRRLQGRLDHLAIVRWRKDSNTKEHEQVPVRSQQVGCCEFFVSRCHHHL